MDTQGYYILTDYDKKELEQYTGTNILTDAFII
jgi:hypothetical protein